jgi:tRNA (guanine10-N2)-dimethyltransferase
VAIPPQLGDALVGSFAVRFVDRWRRLGERDRRRLISLVWRAHPRPVVDLTSPTHDIVVFVHDDRLIFGERVLDCSPDLRMRGRRPFARSYEMPPRTARMLVNSSGTSPGARFLDPFCGTGSLVIEAAIVGTIAIGADVDGSAVRGADLNAGHDGVVATFSVADATRLPLRPESIGSVAADLPYGRSASRRGATGAQLLEATLDALAEPMAPGGQAVLVTLDDGQPQPRPGGWTPSWSLIQPARTLTRRITSWRRSDGAAVSR